jgi:hypothetical protein
MEIFYCLDIAFPNVDFDVYDPSAENLPPSHHAHLYLKKNAIHLKIFYKAETHFDKKFSKWRLNWDKFGSYTLISNDFNNNGPQRIDLASSGMVQATFGGEIENGLSYFTVSLNSAKLYWGPESDHINTADFFLNNIGFRMVSNFYAPLFPWAKDNEFKFHRMKGSEDFFKWGKVTFRPEFEFVAKDHKNREPAKIYKKPKLHFSFPDGVDENEILRVAELVQSIGSFYYHSDIEHQFSKIYFKDVTIAHHQIQTDGPMAQVGGLSSFGLDRLNISFSSFLKRDLQESAVKNHKKLALAIRLFNQSQIIGGSSRFLIRFNIIEIFMGKPQETPETFDITVDEQTFNNKCTLAVEPLLDAIQEDQREDFRKKWEISLHKLRNKPIGSPIEKYLRNEGLPVDDFPITVKELYKLRSSLTHGSVQNANGDKLEIANKLLYSISGILILNHLGIHDWKLFTDIPR